MEVLRREEKYLLNLEEYYQYKKILHQILSTDCFSKNGSYMVRSLYFDTIDDKDFFDKIEEQNLRKKIRIRIYDRAATEAKIELKQKENVFQRKRSLRISRKDAQSIIEGNTSVLLDYKTDFALELYSIMVMDCYKPKCIVEYQREAFLAKENNIRLTFDSQIKATESNYDLFSDNLPLSSVINFEQVIFEVKYDKFLLSYISDVIGQIDRRPVSASKYCLGRSMGYPLYL